ncbi:MAG: HAMP domain-containing protein [Candidatus Moraniibacteriota bacterium]|nr:MAG: HAMP domain-containing protein [Candidatus Moranbacteria bacterium]
MGLEIFSENSEIKNSFLEKDREKLYTSVAPLFKGLKERYALTHLYFHLPDRTVFLRLHDKSLFGDEVKRKTLLNAEKTKEISSGLELGKTAFALRSVIPYYDKDQLIGYLEFGKEIDEFLDILKQEVGDDFVFLGKKELMERSEWEKTMSLKDVSSRWDDNETYVFLGSTNKDTHSSCSRFIDFSSTEDEFVGNEIVTEGEKKYQCSGFSVYDFEKERTGIILLKSDVSETLAFGDKQILSLVLFSGGIFFTFLILFEIVVWRIITSPLHRLLISIQKVTQNSRKQKINIESGYEVGKISSAFNEMIEVVENARENLEEKVLSRTEELEKVNKFMIGRELRMIELKKEINRLKKEKEF